MKRIITGLFLAVLVLAQTPDPTQAFELAYTAMRAPVTDLIVAYNNLKVLNTNQANIITEQSASLAAAQTALATTQTALVQANADLATAKAQARTPEDAAKVAWVDTLDGKCVSCRTALDLGLTGLDGSFQGTLICCGPATVPPTAVGTVIVYISRKPAVTP